MEMSLIVIAWMNFEEKLVKLMVQMSFMNELFGE